jgi:hypothetical protein
MSGVLGYVLGYENGRSDAETSRRNREVVDSVLSGQRSVQVDQSYLDQLHANLADADAASKHNFDAADAFELEAEKWKSFALAQEARAYALDVQLAGQKAALGQAKAALAQEQTAHDATDAEKHGLNLFRLIATWLINAHIAGRAEWPEFLEMRDMAKDVTDAIERSEIFNGYRDEPEKKERLRALLNALTQK